MVLFSASATHRGCTTVSSLGFCPLCLSGSLSFGKSLYRNTVRNDLCRARLLYQAGLAQSVEQMSVNLKVGGSTPPWVACLLSCWPCREASQKRRSSSSPCIVLAHPKHTAEPRELTVVQPLCVAKTLKRSKWNLVGRQVAAPLFGGSRPLTAQKGVQHLEKGKGLNSCGAGPLFGRSRPLTAQKGVQHRQN